MAQYDTLAPVYRYFTADLLTNEIISEIPFRGVNYERALRGAGVFSGSIPVIAETRYLDLYESTMPGNTALYVVRDGICVWGGIIWTRDYDIIERVLTVSASEFTSYFYHRRVWKTWNHSFEATAIVSDGEAEVLFALGSTTALTPDASIYLEFGDVTSNRYNNYYQVGSTELPTTNSFYIDSVTKTVDVVSIFRDDDTVTLTTNGAHNFSTNDLIVVDLDEYPDLNGTHRIVSVGGSIGERLSFLVAGSDIDRTTTTGTVSRTIPDGTYEGITVIVRADTYDYVRSLIDGVFSDFVGVDYPNNYIEPGIRFGVAITQRRLEDRFATIFTEAPHRLSPGQMVEIKDLDPLFDGEHRIISVPAPDRFTFELGGLLALESVSAKSSEILSLEAVKGETTITTVAPHEFLVGQTVDVRTELGFEGLGKCLNGQYTITSTPTSSTFTYTKPSIIDVPLTTFQEATATFSGNTKDIVRAGLVSNTATLTTSSPHGFEVGDTVTVAGVDLISEISKKFYDSALGRVRITTTGPHHLTTSDSVTISGLKDSSQLIDRTITGATSTKTISFTTAQSHNFKNGDVVNITGLQDSYRVSNKAITSNVATLTTSTNHNIPNASTVTVSDIYDTYNTSSALNSRFLENNIATLVLTVSHNIQVNDKVTVSNLVDVVSVVSRSLENKRAILNTNIEHNFFVGDEIVVAGVKSPFNGTFKVTEVTSTQVIYDVNVKAGTIVRPVLSAGTITSKNSVFNGEFVVSERTNTTISYQREANSVSPITAPNGRVRTLSSAFNGTHTVTGVTANTFTYAKTANNVTSVAIPAVKADQEIPDATVSRPSIHSGNRTLTKVTANTLEFTQGSITNNITKTLVNGSATLDNSFFNGTYTITVDSEDTFTYAKTGLPSNVTESAVNSLAYVRASGIFNGSRTITVIDTAENTFSFARTHDDIPGEIIVGYGGAVVTPSAIASTFGPFPGSSDIGIGFPTQGYSGYQILPTAYRGFELANVGEILDSYADNVNGFEYRIDCSFDETTSTFLKTFVIVPINFPDAPESGEVSPLERFGAERLIFEYPGNIRTMTISESAENASTRFFVEGENDLGPDAGPPISIASATDLLDGLQGRRWPLLDDSEKVSDIDDKLILYAYAKRYLTESNPPVAEITLDVNGSLQPKVGTYNPGDWCTVVIDDEFVLARLRSDLEPRDDVIVRKIESIKVSVPDGTTFPEVVSLALIPEWDVDRRGPGTY
jgi:hypothetical protein